MVKIQIVEDERIVAEDIQRSLKRLGYTVSSVVSSGKEAIQKTEEENPDLVLMDIVLKGPMDGIEAAEQINSRFHVPVVYLTAHADEKKLQRAKVTEPYGYILKPFDDKELHTTIEMALYKNKMEKKVKESEKWLATTLRSIGDGVIATDMKGSVTFMNPVAEALTGWTQEEAAGKPLEEIFHIINEETRMPCENPSEKIVKTGKIIGLANNTVLVAKDGTERRIADSGAPICGDDHTILGTVLVFRDVTEKRKMEENLLKMKTEKMESLSVLAGGIAHDFNNILTAILGNVAIAKMKIASENEVSKILTEAEKATLSARDLTQQLLMFSRDEVSPGEPASIAGLLRDIPEFVLRGSGIVCEFLIPDQLWPVTIDAGQISQVINNLVINAEQAMPEGGVLRIGAENVTVGEEDGLPLKDGDYVKVTIKDEGVGIPEDYLQKIFDPYFTTKQRGNGLGLAISYSIIKNHGGYIAVESELGMGTTFSVWLPASKEVVAEEEPDELVRGTEKVLVMDEDENILEVTHRVLEHLGYTTEFARDGKEAIAVYKKALNAGMPFDTVIMDLNVQSGFGGTDVLRELMKIDPHVKAIVCSGYSTDSVISDYRKYGFCGSVTKPYSMEELTTTLQEVIHTGRP